MFWVRGPQSVAVLAAQTLQNDFCYNKRTYTDILTFIKMAKTKIALQNCYWT